MSSEREEVAQNGITFGPNQVRDRPELAIRIASVANSWTALEATAASCLGIAMKADAQATVAILSKISTASARAQAIREVAKATLPEAQLAQLKEIMGKFETLAKRRNDILHGIWGVSDEYPDALIWAPPEIIFASKITLLDHVLAGTADSFLEKQKASFVIYQADKFDALLADIASVTDELSLFTAQQQVDAINAKLAYAAKLAGSIETHESD